MSAPGTPGHLACACALTCGASVARRQKYSCAYCRWYVRNPVSAKRWAWGAEWWGGVSTGRRCKARAASGQCLSAGGEAAVSAPLPDGPRPAAAAPGPHLVLIRQRHALKGLALGACIHRGAQQIVELARPVAGGEPSAAVASQNNPGLAEILLPYLAPAPGPSRSRATSILAAAAAAEGPALPALCARLPGTVRVRSMARGHTRQIARAIQALICGSWDACL